MSKEKYIHIKGARVNNLKNIELKIPRNKLVVVTGLSGSGKSSFAFDTLYAEGQRRYVESLSSYARQFMGRMSKPEVDFITGIPPAIAIEQKVITRNSRSTVGTSTEIYDYLKLLYGRIGKTYSPISGEEVKKHETEDVVNYVQSFEEGTRFMVLTPITEKEGITTKEQLKIYIQNGFSRALVNEEVVQLSELVKKDKDLTHTKPILLLIDRLTVEKTASAISRLTDSVETAFLESNSNCVIHIYTTTDVIERHFSNAYEADGIKFEMPNEHMFSFNNPLGACPTCEGFGKIIGIDEDLVIPNQNLSIYDNAIVCWKGEVMGEWKKQLIYNADKFNFPIHKPYFELTDEQKKLLWTGNKYFEGLDAFFEYLKSNQYKIQYRVMLARYRGKTTCPECKGTRLKKEANYVKVGMKSISEIVNLPITKLKSFIDELQLDEHDSAVSKRLMIEIKNRIRFLTDVGLGYLTLNRLSNTMSGGESQRINLATSLGSSLVGSMYILDEPSIGLHPRDTHLLIKVLKELRDLGNTVIVVEHDEEIMREADYIIDIGPETGINGGEIVLNCNVNEISDSNSHHKAKKSYTLKYLNGEEKIETPPIRNKWSNYIEIKGARENNLKNINVKFPLNIMTVVTGVSGSGKSSLVKNVLHSALQKQLGGIAESGGKYQNISGSLHLIKNVEYVDQNPIGKSTRSNPVTYIKAYDEIRKLLANQQLAKQMGYPASFFSFNSLGGRCEECQGEGTITVEMQFMADLVLQCEHCKGKRFKADTLEVTYQGNNIYDILQMTVDEAIEFFSKKKGNEEKKIVKKLKPLHDVGIGYVQLGQASSTLSGGESQRVKLASYLAKEKEEHTLFIFDEPTTGLHFHDIKTLLKAFSALIARGHTILIIEHNLEIIKCADHIIDMGPEGGETGGNIIFEGTPEELVNCGNSYTGKFLKDKL